MAPNTAAKMTMMSHITTGAASRCRRASFDPGLGNTTRARAPSRRCRARRGRPGLDDFRSPHVVGSPNQIRSLFCSSSANRARVSASRCRPAAKLFLRAQQQHALLFEAHTRPARIQLVARMSAAPVATSTVKPPRIQLDALVVGRAARIHARRPSRAAAPPGPRTAAPARLQRWRSPRRSRPPRTPAPRTRRQVQPERSSSCA